MNMTYRKFCLGCLAAFLCLSLGCKQGASPVTDTSELDEQVTALVLETLESCNARLPDIAPAAVVPLSLMEGKAYSRLEEIIVDRLTEKIGQNREIVALSRENWFEFRESRPLSMKGHHPDMARLVGTLTVFLVSVEAEPLMNRISARIQVADNAARILPGIGAHRTFVHSPGGAARVLMSHPAQDNPAPEGVKENPFHSLEELSYSMAAELRNALDKGLTAAGSYAGPEDIQVVVAPVRSGGSGSGFSRALMAELQQAVLSVGGMNAAVSRADFDALFDVAAFYAGNGGLFENDHELFRPGTVILTADVRRDPGIAAAKVYLRAIWRVTPLKDAYGEVVTGNASGTYVSEFSSRAWFDGKLPEASGLAFTPAVDRGRTEGPLRHGDKGFD